MANRSLKSLIRAKPLDIGELMIKMRDYPDRVVAIILTSHIEDDLEKLIDTRMIVNMSKTDRGRIFDGAGPLSRFSDKILIAFALKLVAERNRVIAEGA